MPDSILADDAGRCGSTAGVVEAVGTALAGRGAPPDVRPRAGMADLNRYAALARKPCARSDDAGRG